MVDTSPGGNYYPWFNRAGGSSLGNRMSALSSSPGSPAKEDAAANPGAPEAYTLGGSQSLLGAGAVLIALLVLLMFVGQRLGNESEFKNVKVTFYNALVIGLMAAVTLPIYKWLVSKQPIGALKNWVMAA